MQLTFLLTNRCNLNCSHCIVNKLVKKDLKFNILEKVATTYDYSSVALLGGEPFILQNFKNIVDLFDVPITIYTNGIHIAKNPNLIIEGDNINYAVSLDGLKENHEMIRGKGTFKIVIEGLKILSKKLNEEKIKSVWIRTTITENNINDIVPLKNIADNLGIKIMYFPLLGNRRPFPEKFQIDLFKWAVKYDNVSIYNPIFWQFCGYKQSTCQAGKYRINITEDGLITPCQWIRDYYLGNSLTTDYDLVKERGIEYNNRVIDVREKCKYCLFAYSCRGGCRLCNDYLTCPIKRGITARNIFKGEIRKIALTKYERTFKNLKIVGC